MVKLAKAFSSFKPFKALVLGDFLLDTYTTGKIRRISPEAPVPIMEVLRQESRPGGAGNVVLNLLSLGSEVFAVGRLGDDFEGRELKKCLAAADTTALFIEPDYSTPVKNRLIAESQQLIRVDFEAVSPMQTILEEKVIKELKKLILKVQVVALSDYGKGFLTDRMIRFALDFAKEKKIPTVVDPKGAEFFKYRGAHLLKPNLSEAYAAAKCSNDVALEEVANRLLKFTDYLFITRSEFGISIFQSQKKRLDFPVCSKQVKDVTGAGDTVLAMICLGLANQLEIQQTAQFANIAAGLSIEHLGCAQITLSQLAERLLKIDSNSKIFDESHTYALNQVLFKKQYALLVLEKGQVMTNQLFHTLRKLKEKKLIIYVRNAHLDDPFVHLLSSLQEVDYIILQTKSLEHLCQSISPSEVFFFRQEHLESIDSIKDVLETLTAQFV